MGLRLVTYARPAEVVPLGPVTDADEDGNEQPPEPRQLYNLIVLALLLHEPAAGGMCRTCAHPWSCDQLRLAWRLREGF